MLMKERVNKLIRNPYFNIVLVYVLAHFFILLLSGCWWDDWTFMSHNLNYVNEVASQSGRPEWNFLVPFCWSLPNNGRPLIFILYLFVSIFVYRLLKNCDLFSEKEALIITMLFSVVPVNDARILISNFAYTVGYFFFYLAFMFFVSFIKMEKSFRKNIYRVLLLCLFFVSFILNSVLAYFYIVMAYLLLLEFLKNAEPNYIKRLFISIKNVLVKYPDFFIIPFVYYGYNKIFFPTYGHVFGSYNTVSISGLFKSFIYIPISIVAIFKDIIVKLFNSLNIVSGLLLVAGGIYAYVSKKKEDKKYSYIDSLKYLGYGLLVIVMALFPYVMVRGKRIYSMGVKGRDAVLTPLGIALLVFFVLSLFKGKIRKVVYVVILLSGIICMNSLYLEWQKDYYYQLSLENLLDNEIIRNNDTFFLVDLNESEIEGQRYYSLNTNGYHVFNDESRLFIPKVSNLYIIEKEENMKRAKEELDYSHVMKDYEPEDLYFDAILNYDNYLRWDEVIEYKMLEIFDNDKFYEEINNDGSLEVVEVDDDFTKLMIKEFNEGKISSDEDVLELLSSYK